MSEISYEQTQKEPVFDRKKTGFQTLKLTMFTFYSSVLYKQASLNDEPVVLLDPNELSADGTIALDFYDFSEDAKLVAYAFSEAGSDWFKIKIRKVDSGEDYPETLERLKFSGTSWTHDNKGFFYAVCLFVIQLTQRYLLWLKC